MSGLRPNPPGSGQGQAQGQGVVARLLGKRAGLGLLALDLVQEDRVVEGEAQACQG